MTYLIFFDINGTIIERDNRTDIPFEEAVKNTLGLKNPMENIDTSARSDKAVFLEILANNDISFSDSLWLNFLEKYQEQLEIYKTTDVWRDNVDAIEFIKWLSTTEHHLSLITGELSIGAKYKLEKLGVWQYFETGGFGEDGLKRFEIAESALNKSKKLYDFDKIIVIGDTTLDIQTARHMNAEIISITTGSHAKELLMTFNPDYIIDKFCEIEHKFK